MRGMYGLGGAKVELPALPKRPDPAPEIQKEKEEVKLPLLHPKPPLLPGKLPTPKHSPKRPLDSFHPVVHETPHEDIEEDIDQQADGLLRWVEELPEEMSVSTSNQKLQIAL